ncbi:hypothetical protein G9A89_015522 [Geosiphon pyriformis]|nr:hypothetical protein G9A89_015522 [Geosiphon pyriformis]
MGLYTTIYKSFVLKNWCAETTLVFEKKEKTALALVEYVRFVVELFCTKIWLIRFKHRMDIEKTGLVKDGGMVSGLLHCLVSMLLDEIVCMLGVLESFAVNFGKHRMCYFFSGLGDNAFVSINA